MENPREVARRKWADARRIRQDMSQKIGDIKNHRGSSNYTTLFKEVEALMQEYRLACVQVIFHDFEYAVEKEAESTLWLAHTSLNGEYRKILGQLASQSQVVQRRKVDKLYREFLKTSQNFYRGYIQRLSDHFYIPELCQAARDLDMAPGQTPDQHVALPAPLCTIILRACSMTLVRLGDLARYRCQTTEKFSTVHFDIALTYYVLASMLDPDDGSSHHQMGVLYQLQTRQLETMYRFHRSISIAKPYKLAPGNLERGFKNILENHGSSAQKRGAAKDPVEALTAWFLKLHAYYYQGRPFKQQEELETEVVHRLEKAMSSGSHEDVVLKMVLINISAYDIALAKVNEKWTIAGSRSCQFVLRFNVRCALILLRQLKTALQANANLSAEADHNGTGRPAGEGSADAPAPLGKLLALFRIYIGWMYASRADLVEYQTYLEPYVREVYGLLAETLTLVFPHVDSNQETTESKYLLPEDTEAVGLRLLSDRKLPMFLKVELSEDGTKRRKTLKPRKEVFGSQLTPHTEFVWRMRDIICCGVYLAGSAKFPLAMSKNSNGVEIWQYTQEGTTSSALDETAMGLTLSKLRLNAAKATCADNDNVIRGSYESVADLDGAPDGSPPAIDQLEHVPDSVGPTTERDQPSQADDNLEDDSEMVRMVSSLVDDDDSGESVRSLRHARDGEPSRREANLKQPAEFGTDNSYGMSSSTAGHIFGGLRSHGVGPDSSLALQMTAAPNKASKLPLSSISQPDNGTGTLYFDDGLSPKVGPKDNENGNLRDNTNAGQSIERPRGQVKVQPWGHFGMAPAKACSPALQRPATSSPQDLSNTGIESPKYITNQRGAALDNLQSALAAQYGFGAASNGQSLGESNAAGFPPHSYARSMSGSSPRGSHNPFAAPTNPVGHASNQQRPSPLASPFVTGHGQAQSNLNYIAGTGSASLGFSNSSNLWTSTPMPPRAPLGAVGCNGNFYNASTAFGRNGEINNREDPSHFRNKMKAIFGADSTSAYDRQILQSALAGDGNKRDIK